MKISYLADQPRFIDELAAQLLVQWRDLLPEDTLASCIARLQRHTHHHELPMAWVAHSNDQVLGTVALRTDDLPGREELTPWLGGLYVVPDNRRQGIGAALCAVVEQQAKSLGFTMLYLFTLDKQRWYERQGWQVHGASHWRNHQGNIMLKHL